MTDLVRYRVQLPHGDAEQFARFGPGWCDLFIREGTSDEDVLREVWIEDTYRVRGIDLAPTTVDAFMEGAEGTNKTVIDLGACTGVFSALCLAFGASYLVAVEPEPDNLQLLARNVEKWKQRVEIIPGAVCGGPERLALLGNTGTGHTEPFDNAPNNPEVVAYYVQEIIDAAPGSIALLKADIEGAEYDAFLACPHEQLARCERIIMETHGPDTHPWVGKSRIGELVQHLLVTHAVDTFGYPARGGMLMAHRYPS